MKLYPHNQEAYEAVMQSFNNGNSKAAIVHATGTGKSFVIAAVLQHFKNPLVIAPNNFVLNETRKVCPNYTDFRTYASVMYDEGKTYGYDIIVLDEFHRSGAEKWGIGIKALLEANPTAKILGTSATHIRYLDNERNMADEMFDGNIVSTLPLKKAIDNGILPNPTYVSSLYSLTDDVARYSKRIKASRMADDLKDDRLHQLKGLASNWDKAIGVPRIIRKYFDHNMQRIIVFCSKIAKAAQARQWLGTWFASAGYKHIRFYNIDYKETRLEKEMEDFQMPCKDGELKVAISVNMLNEGVHIPRVDGVIMLRSTVSRIIIEQQVGRCLTANNLGRTPVVLDLVNNMDTIGKTFCGFGDVRGEHSDNGEETNDDGFPFKVIDECRDIRVFFGQMDDELSWNIDTVKEEALKYATRQEFRISRYCAYDWARKHECLDEVCSHMPKIRIKNLWSEEEVLEYAKTFKTLKQFQREGKGAASAAKRLGIYDKVKEIIKPQRCYWTKDLVLVEARKFKWYNDFNKVHDAACRYAKKYGFINEVYAICPKQKVKWTPELVAKEALKYNARNAFKKGSTSAYRKACELGILDKVCAHMNNLSTSARI